MISQIEFINVIIYNLIWIKTNVILRLCDDIRDDNLDLPHVDEIKVRKEAG